MDRLSLIVEELTDDEDLLELIAVGTIQRERRLSTRYESFSDWNDDEFLNRFRLTIRGAEFVLARIRSQLSIHNDRRGNPVTHEGMLLSTLSFYASGAFMSICGDRHGLSTMSICRMVHAVSRAIASQADDFINMPEGPEEVAATRLRFQNVANFPRCIGAIDCTHIRLQSPGGADAESFRNRKGYFSLNVQTIADADLSISDIVARWPGSAHDSIVFLNSNVRRRFDRGEFRNCVIVGDKGYGLKPYLITPLHNPQTDVEVLFNEALSRTRNVVERSYGVWKRRFPVLANGLRVKLENVEAIVIATAVLHNVAIMLKDELPPIDSAMQQRITESLQVESEVEGEGIELPRNAREPFLQYFQDILARDR